MKNGLLILSLSLAACTKQDPQETEEPMAVTEFISHCDSNWKILETDTCIHWCSVSGNDLLRYKKIAGTRDSSTCPLNNITWIVVGKDHCKIKNLSVYR